MKFNKNVFPELSENDFQKHVDPVLKQIEGLKLENNAKYNSHLFQPDNEAYPYFNICASIVDSFWNELWDNKLDERFIDFISFKKTVRENLTQSVFFNLVRSFAEQIKNERNKSLSDTKNYYAYCNELLSSEMNLFIEQYPVAWSRTSELVQNKIKSLKNSVTLVGNHRKSLFEVFKLDQTALIESITSGGDSHNNGQSVTIFQFNNGQKVVFKPRSTSGEVGYYNFIQEFNNIYYENMKAIKAVDFGEYGFTEFIDATENSVEDMVKTGKIAALMYLLNASDMHYSNVFWYNSNPIPIDLETLFQPQRVKEGLLQSENSAYRKMAQSVYGTGILPFSLSVKGSESEVDVGFAGIRDEYSVSPFRNFEILDGFSSNIKIVWSKRKNIDESLIRDDKFKKEMITRSESIIQGFTTIYNKVLRKESIFLSIVTESFKNAKFRYIHNMTYRYEQILRTLTDAEPSHNMDMATLILSRAAILSTSSSEKIVVSECSQLWKGDIPYFSVIFDKKKIFYKNEPVASLNQAPQEEFLKKIRSLSEADLNRQIKLIRLAFVAKISDSHNDKITKKTNNDKSEEQYIVIENILKLANDLVQESLNDRYNHLPETWIGPVSRQGGRGWAPGVLGYDLYAGRIGPALALAAAGRVTGNKKIKNLSENIFDKSANILQSKTYEIRNVLASGVGAFSGVSGMLWSLYIAGCITNNNFWKKVSKESWYLLESQLLIVDDQFFDLISGKSGATVMRYMIDDKYSLPENITEKVIKIARKKIIEAKTDITSQLTSGIAHGLSQILWFFSIINQRDKNIEFTKIILDAHHIIEKCYQNTNGMIKVYSGAPENNVSSTWCNGISGILIAYIEAFKAGVISSENVKNIIIQLSEVEVSNIPIYCHGSLGVFDAVNYASEYFPKETKNLIHNIKNSIGSSCEVEEYFSKGKSRYSLSSGIMSGKSGAILHLCKQIDKDIRASVVTLKP